MLYCDDLANITTLKQLYLNSGGCVLVCIW